MFYAQSTITVISGRDKKEEKKEEKKKEEEAEKTNDF